MSVKGFFVGICLCASYAINMFFILVGVSEIVNVSTIYGFVLWIVTLTPMTICYYGACLHLSKGRSK